MHGGDKTVISVMVSQPAPKQYRDEYKRPPLKEKVNEYIRRIESSDSDVEYEWNYLKRLYECLSRKPKLTECQGQILKSLEELFEKYGNHDHEGSVDLDAQYMHRYDDDDDLYEE